MEKPKRILFLDLMRVLALFMMIQGHTVYEFLDNSILHGDSLGIWIWTSLRGYTAPFFMMVSGTVFTFLMLSQEKPDGSNPRIKAGARRIITLLFWGYLLNFPAYVIRKIFTHEGVDTFLNIRIGETLTTIFFISLALYMYRSLLADEKDNAKDGFMKRLFREGALKHMKFREGLFNKGFFQAEERRKRLFSSVFYGILISIPFLIIANFLNIDEKKYSLRTDVLHIIAVGLLLVMFVYFITRHIRWLMALVFFLLIITMIAVYPLVNKVALTELPISLAPYLNDFETNSQFTIFPWLAYIFGGGLLGIWLSYEIKKPNFERVIGFKLAAIGLGFLLLSELGIVYESHLYGRSYYWYDSPNLIYHRFGIVMCVGSVMAFLSLVVRDLPKFMKEMSRNTLWLYIGHLLIIYQLVRTSIIGYERRFSLPVTILFVVVMFILMFLQTKVIVFVQKKGGYIALLKWTWNQLPKPKFMRKPADS